MVAEGVPEVGKNYNLLEPLLLLAGDCMV